MNRILFLGMDLSGKSQNSKRVAETLGINSRSNLLTLNRELYKKAVNKMRTENLTDEEALCLFETIYQDDLNYFNILTEEQNTLLVQDNFGIIRNIANFYYKGHNVDKLIEILKCYEQPKHSFYLTCSKEERIKRLNERDKPEDMYEKLLRKDPEAFYELDCIAHEIYSKYFDCEIIDNTHKTEEETLEYVLKKVR